MLYTTPDWPKEEWPEPIERVNASSPTAFARKLNEMSAQYLCDALFSLERVFACHVYRAGDGVHAAWLQRRARFEPAWRSWFRGWSGKHREILALETALFRDGGAGRVIANSQLVADEIVTRFGFDRALIDVVYNGLPKMAVEPEQRAATRAELNLAESDYVALFAGSGWERKGLRFAVEAVRQTPGMTLLVAGRGRIRGLGSSERVRFLGPRHDVPRLLAAADVFILPTIYDPFSNASLEALAAGLPVITTVANGFSEIIAPGIEGEVIAQPDDIPALAAALEKWRDPARREAIRTQLAALGARFSIEGNVRQTLAVIESAAAAK